MKLKSLGFYLLGICFLVACGKIVTNTPSILTTSLVDATVTSLPVEITKTPIPTLFTPINTLRPTLTAEESIEFILDLLKTNHLCNFPCFWGISPGKSWKAALEQLQGFILYINATPQTNNSTLHTISSNVGLGKKGITYNITVSEDKDLIEYVAAQLISENFADKLDAFTPQEILSRYGSPEKVQLYVGNDTENPEYQFYHLWFVYDKKNFYVLYTGYARNVQNSYEICPLVQHFDLEGHSDNYGIVEFASILRSSADSLEKFIKERDQLFGNSQSIEVASGLSSTDFTDLVLKDGSACFNTSSELWINPPK